MAAQMKGMGSKMDFLEYMRQRNIFGPPGGIIGNDLPSQGGFLGTRPYGNIQFGPTDISAGQGVASPTPAPIPNAPPAEVYDAAKRMKELYQPTYEASEAFENMIKQYPQQQKPGWLRAIAAMITDYTRGPEAGQAVFDRNRQERIMDWKNQIAPLQSAANLERQENVNARTLAYQQISAELKDKALEAKMANDERKAEIAEFRAKVYDFKARNPTMKIILPKGGNVTAVNPITGETFDLGVPTGSLTEIDKLNMQQENRLEQIAAGGAEARATEGVRQAGREQIAETRGWTVFNIPDPTNPGQMKAVKINQITGEVKDITQGAAQTPVGAVSRPSGAGAAAKPETAANKKAREYLLARELYNRNPKFRQWIHLDNAGPNSFFIDVPGISTLWGSTGPSQKDYKEMQDYIFGVKPMSVTVAPGGAATKYGEESYNEPPTEQSPEKRRIISITPVK